MMEGYVYKILFEDGCWYWGTSVNKGVSPESDGYYGSPITHKDHWNTPHSKIVVKVFTDEEDRLEHERLCILPDLDNPRCLNEHAIKCFSKEACRKGGQTAAQKSRGIPRTSEVRSKISDKLQGRVLSSDHVQKLKKAKRPPKTPEAIAKAVETRRGYKHSKETKRKIGDGNKGRKHSEELKNRIADSVRGYKWYNNGVESIQSHDHPGDGWREGRIVDWRTPRNKGMKWYHKNGKCKMFRDNPGEGWIPGRLRA